MSSNGLTDILTDTHDNYSNPRCACAPRVKKKEHLVPMAYIHIEVIWLALEALSWLKRANTKNFSFLVTIWLFNAGK
jgi:hypothetical protein